MIDERTTHRTQYEQAIADAEAEARKRFLVLHASDASLSTFELFDARGRKVYPLTQGGESLESIRGWFKVRPQA